MRRVVQTDPLHEEEIRPRALFDRYLELLAGDVGLLLESAARVPRNCPACGAREAEPTYQKLGFQYQTCLVCDSLYVSPSPTETQLVTFYRKSEAVAYWREQLAAETEQMREPGVLKPRVDWVTSMISNYFPTPVTLLDLDGNYPYFLARLMESGIVGSCYSAAHLPGLPEPDIPQGDNQFWSRLFSEPPDATVDVVTAFEVIERAANPIGMVQACSRWLCPSGLLFITSISGAGFDVRLLGEQVRHVVPPTHLNLLSRRGLQSLLDRTGFELLEFSTPGRLDVELAAQAKAADPNLLLPPILDELVSSEDEEIRSALQQLLQRARLSSHVRIVAQRR